MNNSAPVLQLQQLTLQRDQQPILNDINLDIHAGEFITLLGPSGCGKTSLLQLIAGFIAPTAGRIHLNGSDITRVPPQQRAINTVFQQYALFPHLNVYDNVAFGLTCQGHAKALIQTRVNAALAQVHLAAHAARYPHQLSGGQQQRVAIARAIINRPSVLLLDEPLSALDYQLRQAMQQELKKLQHELGITFLFVTHDQQEALRLSDRIVVMDAGDIIQVGTPRDIYERPCNLQAASFIGQSNVFDATVTHCHDDNTLTTDIAHTTIRLNNTLQLQPGDAFHMVLRPEDFQVWAINEPHNDRNKIRLAGHISAITYQGATVELHVTLQSGMTITTTAFFDEDDDTLDYRVGEAVNVEWIAGWEVLLPHATT